MHSISAYDLGNSNVLILPHLSAGQKFLFFADCICLSYEEISIQSTCAYCTIHSTKYCSILYTVVEGTGLITV